MTEADKQDLRDAFSEWDFSERDPSYPVSADDARGFFEVLARRQFIDAAAVKETRAASSYEDARVELDRQLDAPLLRRLAEKAARA